jgi:hypothetical protein
MASIASASARVRPRGRDFARHHSSARAHPRPRPPRASSASRRRRDARRPTTIARAQSVVDALAAVDAWSVTSASGTALRFIPPGIETQLFQVGLAPYLAYLWFLRDARATPRASNFGARFLLLFVAATIPAGIVAKTRYGDILANVDALHGSSESLLTVSNALFAYGFGAAAGRGDDGEKDEDGEERATTPAYVVLGVLFLTCAASKLAIGAVAPSIVDGELLASEPGNALSLPTWAVHVSSVTEWALAMKYVAGHADRTGNASWRNLTVAMSPFLASGITACTFHAFYNPASINALVPLQALLTLMGNTGCAVAAYTIATNEKDGADSETPVLEGAAPIEDGLGFALKLALWTSLASTAVKYGELASPFGAFFAEPSYGKALGMIALPSVVWTYYALNSGANAPKLTMQDVKSFGVAGTVSYVIIELAFWAVAAPVAFTWYKVAEGTWLDLSDPTDKAKLFGAGAVFINVVRLFVPLRLAAALALAPVVAKFVADNDDD